MHISSIKPTKRYAKEENIYRLNAFIRYNIPSVHVTSNFLYPSHKSQSKLWGQRATGKGQCINTLPYFSSEPNQKHQFS